jgi:hypothetical protein
LSQTSQSSIEHVLVESCDDLIAKENDELKQEVEKLQRELYVSKEKIKVQPFQDNHEDMVKKLEKGSLSLAQLLNNIQRPTRTRFKKRARLGTSSPNIAQPSTRHKNHSPRSLEAQTSGECATSVKRRATLPMLSQVQQWAVALTVTGQTSAGQVCHHSSKQAKGDLLSKNKAQEQAWTRNCKKWCDQQEQKLHLL